MKQANEQTITVDQTAGLLGFNSRTAVIRLIRAGELRGYQLSIGPTSPFRIYADSVVDFARRVQKREIKIA